MEREPSEVVSFWHGFKNTSELSCTQERRYHTGYVSGSLWTVSPSVPQILGASIVPRSYDQWP